MTRSGSDAVVETLTALIAEHGPSLSSDRRRVEAFLSDLCPTCVRETALIGVAVRHHVPRDLGALRGGLTPADLQRLSSGL